MSKIQNLGGFITIPIPSPNKFPMTFDTYKKEYGVDLMDILTDDTEGNVPVFKSKKPILTEDVDHVYKSLPSVSPLVSTVADDGENAYLRLNHGYFPDRGFYMEINWANKTLSGGEY